MPYKLRSIHRIHCNPDKHFPNLHKHTIQFEYQLPNPLFRWHYRVGREFVNILSVRLNDKSRRKTKFELFCFDVREVQEDAAYYYMAEIFKN